MINRIHFPSNYSSTEKNRISIRGSAITNASGIQSVRVNGTNAASANQFASWKADVNLEWGVNEISIVAQDSLGANDTQTIYVKRAQDFERIVAIADDPENHRVLVLDNHKKAIFAVDKNTGARRVFSNNTTPSSAQPFDNPVNMAIDIVNNRLLVLDNGSTNNAVIAVDLATGTRSIFAPYTSDMWTVKSIAINTKNGDALIGCTQKIFKLNLTTRDISLLLDNSSGSGYYITSLNNIAIDEQNDRAFFTDNANLMEVDLKDHKVRVVSNNQTPNNTPWSSPLGLLIDSKNNQALVTHSTSHPRNGSLVAVDLTNGHRMILSDFSHTDNINHLSQPSGIIMSDDQQYALIAETSYSSIIKINIESGNQEVLSDNSVPNISSGTPFHQPLSLSINHIGDTLYLMDDHENTLFSVDRATSQRHILTSESSNNGSNNYSEMVYDKVSNQLFIVNHLIWGIIAIDIDNFYKSIFYQVYTPGSGAPLSVIYGLDIDTDSRKLYVTNFANGFFSIDMETKAVSLIANNTVPNANHPFSYQSLLKLDIANNRALMIDITRKQLISVSLTTGNRSIISSNATPNSGIPFESPTGIAIDKKRNRAIITDIKNTIAVDLNTGYRVSLANTTTAIAAPRRPVLDEDCNCMFFINYANASIQMMDLSNGNVVTFSR